MCFKSRIDSITLIFTPDGYFQVKAMIFSGTAAAGWRDLISVLADDFHHGPVQFFPLAADDLIEPLAGITDLHLTIILLFLHVLPTCFESCRCSPLLHQHTFQETEFCRPHPRSYDIPEGICDRFVMSVSGMLLKYFGKRTFFAPLPAKAAGRCAQFFLLSMPDINNKKRL
jgi:hypothetical protein